MASFNVKYFEELVQKIDKGEDIESTLELVAKLAVPVRIAEDKKLLEKLAKLAAHITASPSCKKIVEKMNEMKKREEEQKTKKDRRNERAREAYKRKKAANEMDEDNAKKMKLEKPEKSPVVQEANATTQKTKAAPKKTNLMMKCLRDANKLRKQFK